jgi:hypothetical protein
MQGGMKNSYQQFIRKISYEDTTSELYAQIIIKMVFSDVGREGMKM